MVQCLHGDIYFVTFLSLLLFPVILICLNDFIYEAVISLCNTNKHTLLLFAPWLRKANIFKKMFTKVFI